MAALAFAPHDFPLRDYQREALQAVEKAWSDGTQRPLIVLPTGAGKTVIFTHLAKDRASAGRTLILVHRDELVTQTMTKLIQIAPELSVGVVKAQRDEHAHVDVIIASVQTLAREHRLAPLVGTIATIIIDEAHHAVAATYRAVVEGLGGFREGGPKVVGVTATAGGRSDGAAMGDVWERIVYERGILSMIVGGHLRDVKALHLTTDADLGNVKTSRGDYTDSSLGQELTDSGAIGAAALGYATHAKDRRGIAFTPTLDTAEQLAAELNRRGIKAEMICGDLSRTSKEDRKAVLARLKSGETQVVTNAAVLTEGFDEPMVSCVLIVRPTKARGLFVQMAGRCLRKDMRAPGALTDGPERALILDLYAPPSAGLATIADLIGDEAGKVQPKPGETLLEAMDRTEEETAAAENKTRIRTQLQAKQVKLFGGSRLRWLPIDSAGWALSAGDVTLIVVQVGDPTEDQWDVLASSRADGVSRMATGLPLEYAQGLSEEHAKAKGLAIASATAAWRGRPASAKQVAALRSMKLPIPETSGEASDLMSASMAAKTATRYLRSVAM